MPFNNKAYTSKKEFVGYIKTGSKPSNAYYGSAQISEPIWKKVTFPKSTYVFDLVGGKFVPYKGKCYEFKYQSQPPKFMPFTKTFNRERGFSEETFTKLKSIEPYWKDMCKGNTVR